MFKHIIDALIMTVGTSSLGYYKADNEGSEPNSSRELSSFWKSIQSDPQKLKRTGAEITSLFSMIKKGTLAEKVRYLDFFISNTKEGRLVGKALQNFINGEKIMQVRFERVELCRIEGLTGENFHKFKHVGLRNLVNLLSEKIQKRQDEGCNVAINATGGYKAQISFAGLVGQALEVPVYYQFENFEEIIEVPPMPVDFDIVIWLENYLMLEKISDDYVKIEDLSDLNIDINSLNPKIAPLIERDGEYICASPILALMHRSFSKKFERKKKEILPEERERNIRQDIVIHKDHHYPRGLGKHLEKVWDCSPYVIKIETSYSNIDLSCQTSFRISPECRPNQIEGTYSDGKATARFYITTTARTKAQNQAVAVLLNQKFTG